MSNRAFSVIAGGAVLGLAATVRHLDEARSEIAQLRDELEDERALSARAKLHAVAARNGAPAGSVSLDDYAAEWEQAVAPMDS